MARHSIRISDITGSSPAAVTQLLLDWSQGDKAALGKLTPLIYDELRRLARRALNRERPGHTLQATALVHEAYLQLVDQRSVSWHDRDHFFGVAAQVMRRILVDHARRHCSAKRGGGACKLSLDDAVGLREKRGVDLVALDDAMRILAEIDPQRCKVVELRFFGGLSIEETGRVLGVSPATIIRQWRLARAWLYHEIKK